MSSDLNENGQPVQKAFGWKRLKDSRFDELIGFCRGILADGAISENEAHCLRDWLERNPAVRTGDVGKTLYTVLCRSFQGDALDPQAETELVDILLSIIGGRPDNKHDASLSTTFPLNNPPPAVSFDGKSFCFTGKFKFGTRSSCEEAVLKLGGLAHKNPNHQTSFLVIGEIGSRDWIHSSSGRKIERAVELRGNGLEIGIICEATWCAALEKFSRTLNR
jgi:NAD-dependent DNA ligase